MDALIAFIAGGTIGVLVDLLIKRYGRDKLLIRFLRPLRDQASGQERIIEELDHDPFFGRDYARPAAPRRSKRGDKTPALTP